MAKCKYPEEVCANMTVLNGTTYCDSTPCSLKDELPVFTNGDWIRSLDDKELADFICNISKCHPHYCPAYQMCMRTEHGSIDKWIKTEFKEEKE